MTAGPPRGGGDGDSSRPAKRSLEGAPERRRALRVAGRARRADRTRRLLPWTLAALLAVAAGATGVSALRAEPTPTATPVVAGLVAEPSIAPTGAAGLRQPTGVALSGGRVYVADPGAAAIAVFGRDGSKVATIGAGDLVTPVYVAIGPHDGRVYVSDRGLGSVVIYTRGGTRVGVLPPWGTGPATEDTRRPWSPLALSFAPDGTLHVADVRGDQRIAVFSPAGVRTASVGAGLPIGRTGRRLSFPDGIAAIGSGLLVCDTGNGRLLVLDGEGRLERTVNVGGAPCGVALLPDGRLVLADSAEHVLRILGADAAQVATAGGPGTAPGQFDRPNGVAADGDGRVHVADAGNARVSILRITGGAPGGGTGSGRTWGWASVSGVLALAAVASCAVAIAGRRTGEHRTQGRRSRGTAPPS